MRLELLSAGLLAFAADVDALHFPVIAKRSNDLARRGNAFGSSTLNNTNDFQYYTSITLGGKVYNEVLIDTGSSDLWIAGSVPNTNNTNIATEVHYAVGSVKGIIKMATLEFANHTVQDQAFIEVDSSYSHPNNTGIIGLGPNTGSNIFHALSGASVGAAPIDRIFRANTSIPNYITALLGRSNDPTDTFPGDITISEVVPGFEDIRNQPKLNCTQVSLYNLGDQHWQALLDPDGIEVNGKAISLPDSVVNTTANPKQLTAMFDTGFTVPQVPKSISDAIYSGISGAKLDNVSGIPGEVWTFDCKIEVNVTFKFGGKSFPIHPLDASLYANGTSSPDGKQLCFGGFQPAIATKPTFDMILGMAFLRNAYILINYGDFVEGASDTTADPYIQLLALTNDTAEAHADFVRVRNGSSGGHHVNTKLLATALAVAAGLILLFAALWGIMRHIRNRRTTGVPANKPWGAGSGAYYPLGAPAPNAAAEVHQGGPQHAPYQAPYQPHDVAGRPPRGGEADEYYNQPAGRGQGIYSNPFDDRH